jgi:putative addiction module component (TIGR02574 family)
LLQALSAVGSDTIIHRKPTEWGCAVSIELEELKQAAAKLSEAERAELAYVLIQSLDPDTEEADEFEVERAWLVEVERRAGEVDRGEVRPVPGDEAFARLHRKFG